jgi:hypothetical protein
MEMGAISEGVLPYETAQPKKLAGEEGGGLKLLEIERLQRLCHTVSNSRGMNKKQTNKQIAH